MYDVDSVLEEQLFPHPVQGGMSMQDVDQGFCSQMSTNQVNLKKQLNFVFILSLVANRPVF